MSEEDYTNNILDLYLKGARSIMLAVSYVQRKDTSSNMWDILIDHCLGSHDDDEGEVDGSLFGLLLEAAALSGTNVANIVERIPKKLAIEGLRPKLLTAISDYQLKLSMHSKCYEIACREKSDLIVQKGHRSRRGIRTSYHNWTFASPFDVLPDMHGQSQRFPRTKKRGEPTTIETSVFAK